jgi:hypothetical protein
MIIEVIHDATPFFVIMAITIIGLFHAYVIQLGGAISIADYHLSFLTMYQYVVGGDGLESDSGNPGMAVAVWLLSNFLGSVVMLNLLIAIMGDTYERVQEKAEVMRYRELAGILLEVEGFMPHAWLSRRNAGYLFVARPAVSSKDREKNEPWKGFAGEIRHEVKQTQKSIEEITAAMVAQQKHIEETTAARLSHIEETTAARLSRIEAQLERLLEAYSKTALPEGSRD